MRYKRPARESRNYDGRNQNEKKVIHLRDYHKGKIQKI